MRRRARKAGSFAWRNLAVISLIGVAITFTIGQAHNNRRIDDNHNRLSDIEQVNRSEAATQRRIFGLIQDVEAARVESCRRTYEAVRQIFMPFLADSPDKKGVRLFNARIDALKRDCPRQTHATKGGAQ